MRPKKLICGFTLVLLLFSLYGCNETKSIFKQANNEKLEEIINIYSGNTFGNISNSGKIASDGEWIFYSEVDKTKKSFEVNYSFYKIKEDGTNKILISEERASYINVVGDWVYYTNHEGFFKILKDGTNKIQILNDEVAFINIIDDWIYFVDYESGYIYKMKTDESSLTLLCEDSAGFINVVDDWIYYSNGSDNNSLYKIKTDGTQKNKD